MQIMNERKLFKQTCKSNTSCIGEKTLVYACVCRHFVRFINRPVISGFGLYDPTSIMNASELNRAQREGWVKLAFYILLFFYYIYGYVIALFL